MKELNFTASCGSPPPSNKNYFLHCHDEYEVYMFIEGDSRYVIEDKNYFLSPDDVIIIRKREMHRVWHNSEKPYSRITITVSPEFFSEWGCKEYEKAFLEPSRKGNKINADVVHKSGLYDAIMRMKAYTCDFESLDTPIAATTLVEVLYSINQISNFENSDESNKPIEQVINYINNHFTEEISLDKLCETFFVSKYYLCHGFKKHTGITVQTYIREKRFAMFEEKRKEERLLTECASLSGFTDYSAFYRAYIKKYGKSPKK